jgi:N-acetylglucosaminylphosphatidylinositol deacetylase
MVIGNANDMGKIRKKELQRAAKGLGVVSVTIIDDNELQDGMQEQWDALVIQKYVSASVIDKKISTIVTFDEQGVSGHANHRSIYKALSRTDRRYKLFTLKTVSLTKYASVLDLWPSLLQKQLLILASPLAARHAMEAHASQMVWFRRFGWCIFSRYIIINQLQEEL